MVMETEEVVSLLFHPGDAQASEDWPVISAGDVVPELAQGGTQIAPNFEAFVQLCLASLAESNFGSAYWHETEFDLYAGPSKP
jgi:hypothetical protein